MRPINVLKAKKMWNKYLIMRISIIKRLRNSANDPERAEVVRSTEENEVAQNSNHFSIFVELK